MSLPAFKCRDLVVVLFTYLNTEQDRIRLCDDSGDISYSGTEVPDQRSVFHQGTIEITWRSDVFCHLDKVGSLFTSPCGLTMLESEVPPSALPVGATDLLVISNSSGGEMASGVTTPLVDYNPPAVVPRLGANAKTTTTALDSLKGHVLCTRASVMKLVHLPMRFSGATPPIPLSATLGSVGTG